MTAWLNLIGLVAAIAGIDYGCAQFMTPLLGLAETPQNFMRVFGGLLVSHAVLNHIGIRTVARLNDFSAITYDSANDISRNNAILRKYEVADLPEFNLKSELLLSGLQKRTYFFTYIILSIMLLFLAMWWAPRLKVLKLESPAKKQAGKKLETVQALVDSLHTEAKVI